MSAALMSMSSRSFALWWLSLLLLHGITAAFFSFCALFYSQLKATRLGPALQYHSIGMASQWYSTIALLLFLTALPHALTMVKMISASLFYRSLAFTFGSNLHQKAKLSPVKTRRNSDCSASSRQAAPFDERAAASRQPRLVKAPEWISQIVSTLRDRHGVFGVEGPHFHAILFCREVFETTLQTLQAYRMSLYLPRVWLNRFYVVMIVLSCWLNPLIHWAYRENEAKKRLLCLVCNCALDLVSCVVIPCAILASYAGSYNTTIKGFDALLWYNDVWLEYVVHEFQILLVVSWRDLASRLVFSVGILIAMSDIKDLVGVCCISGNQITLGPGPSLTLAAVMPLDSDNERRQSKPTSGSNVRHQAPIIGSIMHRSSRWSSLLQQRVQSASLLITQSKFSHYLALLMHGLLLLWGLTILALHVYTESTPEITQCLLQVRPWGRAQPACLLVLLNCYSSGISGSAAHIEAEWALVDPEMVVRVLIRHCEALEMPPLLQGFLKLNSLKVYNSTIATWGEQAAITNRHHPHMTAILFVRVNLTDGELPQGLLSNDFPSKLTDIEFSVSNLHVLPPDLDTKWPKYSLVYLEKCAFTEIPDVALRLLPVILSFQGNPIAEIPKEIFESASLMDLHVGDTPVRSLPEVVARRPGTPPVLIITNTQISDLPFWMDSLIVTGAMRTMPASHVWIFAGGTRYCSETDSYPSSTSALTASRSTAAPPRNIGVNCNPVYAAPFIPLHSEDLNNGL